MTDILELGVHHGDEKLEDDSQLVEVGIANLKERARKRKGRGFNLGSSSQEKPSREALKNFESVSEQDELADVKAKRSVQGWILMVTGIHDEAHEEDIRDPFGEFGEIKNLHLNLDRKTGYLRGYALIEYEHFKDAAFAITKLDGATLLGDVIHVDWAFLKKPHSSSNRSLRRR